MRSQKSEVRSQKYQKWLLVACCLLLASTTFAAFSKVGTVAAPFLKISVGRPTGMGDAFTGIADDASAMFYNPAGLAGSSIRVCSMSPVLSDVMLTPNVPIPLTGRIPEMYS